MKQKMLATESKENGKREMKKFKIARVRKRIGGKADQGHVEELSQRNKDATAVEVYQVVLLAPCKLNIHLDVGAISKGKSESQET